MTAVWVVVQEVPYESSTIVGVYASKRLADLAADHPWSPLTVREFELVAEQEVGIPAVRAVDAIADALHALKDLHPDAVTGDADRAVERVDRFVTDLWRTSGKPCEPLPLGSRSS